MSNINKNAVLRALNNKVKQLEIERELERKRILEEKLLFARLQKAEQNLEKHQREMAMLEKNRVNKARFNELYGKVVPKKSPSPLAAAVPKPKPGRFARWTKGVGNYKKTLTGLGVGALALTSGTRPLTGTLATANYHLFGDPRINKAIIACSKNRMSKNCQGMGDVYDRAVEESRRLNNRGFLNKDTQPWDAYTQAVGNMPLFKRYVFTPEKYGLAKNAARSAYLRKQMKNTTVGIKELGPQNINAIVRQQVTKQGNPKKRAAPGLNNKIYKNQRNILRRSKYGLVTGGWLESEFPWKNKVTGFSNQSQLEAVNKALNNVKVGKQTLKTVIDDAIDTYYKIMYTTQPGSRQRSDQIKQVLGVLQRNIEDIKWIASASKTKQQQAVSSKAGRILKEIAKDFAGLEKAIIY